MMALGWRRGLGRFLLLVQTAGALGGCSHWEVQPLVPQAVIEREHPSRVRVVQTDSFRLELRDPRVENDSLTGIARRQRRAIPLDRVASVSTRKSNAVTTLLLLAGVLSAGMITLLAATYNQ